MKINKLLFNEDLYGLDYFLPLNQTGNNISGLRFFIIKQEDEKLSGIYKDNITTITNNMSIYTYTVSNKAISQYNICSNKDLKNLINYIFTCELNFNN